MRKNWTAILLCLVIAACSIGLFACGEHDGTDPVTYTLSYASGAEDAVGTAPEAKAYAAGTRITLASDDTFTREGYSFDGWSDGSSTHAAEGQFVMPEKDVTLTAVWKSNSGEKDPGTDPKPDDPQPSETDVPTLGELDAKFYTASNWVYMTNNNGASTDGGDIVYSLGDGSVKFHRANQAIELGDKTNATVSFMLKGTNDWSIWFNSSSKDNANNSSYRIAYAYGGLRLVVSSAPDRAAANIDGAEYAKGEWNRFDIAFATADDVTEIKVYINGKRAALTEGDNDSPLLKVENNVLSHEHPANFTTGTWAVVKVWEANNYVQLKPVAKADEPDVPVIACIGASITEGAGAGNFYTESYPAQLQNALGGDYNVINFGKSGRTVRTDLGNESNGTPIAWLENPQFEGVKAIKPDYAIFNIGTNDSKTSNDPVSTQESFKTAYEHLLDEVLKANPKMQIYICTVPYAYSSIYDISNDNIRDIIAPVQREVAEEREYTLIDLYEYVQNKSLLFGDGVHPNTIGYAMFVEIIKKAFEEGEDGLTQEFLAYIDEKYNDPAYELTGVRGAVAVVGDAINLTVTGNLVMEDTSKLRLVVETGTAGEEVETPMTPDADGNFSGTLNLATLTSTKWYNVRVYITDTFYYFLRLNETDYEKEDVFHTDTKQVTVKSWVSGGEDTFSFVVGAYSNIEFTLASSTITTVSDKLVLTVSGTSEDDGIRLYIGADPSNSEKYNEYKNITVESDGSFTAAFDLSELPVGGWYNARIYFTDGSYYAIGYAETTDGEKALTTNDYFLTENTKIEIKSWTDGKVGTLSFDVKEYNSSVVVTPTSVTMSDGKLVFTGTTTGVTTLVAALNDKDEYVQQNVTIEADGTFTVELALADMTHGAGNWYYLKVKVNDGTEWEKVNVQKTDDTFVFGDRVYKWEYWEGIAVSYSAYSGPTVTLSKATIEQVGETVMLTIEGSLSDIRGAYDKTLLYVGNNADNAENYHEVTKDGDNQFTVTFDLATLSFGNGIQIRFYHSRTDGDSKWGYYTLKIPEVKLKSGETETDLAVDDSFTVGDKKITVYTSATSWNPLDLLVEDMSYEMNVTDVKFENGKLVVSGTTDNVTALVVSLVESNQSVDQTATINADGSFTVKFNLTELTSGNGNWYRLKVSVNGGDADTVPYYDGFDTKMQYTYDERTYKFTTEWSTTTFTLLYSASGYNYKLTTLSITEVDGKATLTIEGTLTDNTVAASSLTLILNKTSGTAETLTFNNEATEAGTFRFVIDISEIAISAEAAPNANHYFVRLYKDGAKLYDINSTWAGDKIFEPVEIGDSVYYFSKNNATAYYTLGVIRTEKA